ncbi:TNF receptor-associated factor 5-like isoform X1 [Halichondria panicea]|uniref:TNF receptor-associated factor 5-like isoform X1 n=1 Tax=Halichondria panicea TaxID=6063 RepID=UPI00312B56EC
MASKNRCVAEPDQSPPHVVQEPPTNETAELDYDFVEQPDQDYFCPVSLELLVEPHQTSCCGHHVSQQAANRLIREQKPCPMCKDDEFNTQSDKYFKRKIRQLKVRCPHKKSGCEWTGELGDLNHHTTSCPKRPWKCQYCDHESIYETGPTDHTPNCPNYPLSCPNQCEIGTLSRCQADSHLLECPLQLVECEFASTGCDVKVPRRDLAGHMTENAQHHLMTATLLNLRLTKELHKKMEEKDQQIVELKQQVGGLYESHSKFSRFFMATLGFVHYEITLPNFSSLEQNNGWLSEPLSHLNGIKFHIKIDADDPPSAYLTAQCSSDEPSIVCTIMLELLNQHEDKNHFSLKKTISLRKKNSLFSFRRNQNLLDMFGSVQSQDEGDESDENVDGKFETKVIGELPSLAGNAEQDVLYLLNDALKFQVHITVDTCT